MVSDTKTNTDHTAALQFIREVRERVATIVVGQEVVVERLLISLFTGGHLLLQGVPGIAKTLLASTLSQAIDLTFSRIQFTIDLLPSDILGSVKSHVLNGFEVDVREMFDAADV